MLNPIKYCKVHGCVMKYVGDFGRNRQLGSCPECFEELKQADEIKNTQRLKALGMLNKMNAICIPKHFEDKNLDNFMCETEVHNQSFQEINLFIEAVFENREVSHNLLIHGPTGTGKSHLAVGLLKEMSQVKQQFSCQFTTSYELANKVMQCWSNNEKDQESVYKEYFQVDLLLIDDLGYNDNAQKQDIVNTVLYRRHLDNKSTVITTNLLMSDVSKYMGDRIASRFFGSSIANIELVSEDYRLTKLT